MQATQEFNSKNIQLPAEHLKLEVYKEDINNKQPRKVIPQYPEEIQQNSDGQSKDTIRLDFKDVSYEVTLKGGHKKQILNNVSGYVLPGEILYIMGPSGGGKTSLLDFLCNRTQVTPEKNVYLNQKLWTEKEFKKVARYCQQHPQLFEVFTVQETLEYAASFFTKTKEDRKERVDRVIRMLGLEDQRNTKIGGQFYRGVSGGQKQRVSVGEQLVANPKLLFLDEPTSGLDSATAFQLMDNLKEICKQTQISVISSIHQPSQRVFDISDRLIILAGGKGFGGNTAYFGLTCKLESHLNSIGFYNESKSSICEWILDQVNGDFGNSQQIQQILEKYTTSEAKRQTDSMQEFTKKTDYIEKYKYNGPDTKQSSFQDMYQLMHRGLKNNLKNPLAVGVRILTYAFMSMITGSVWWQIADNPKAGDVQNILGVLFFSSAFFSVMSISNMPINIEDRLIMTKERTNGAYKLVPYSIANFIVNLPFTFIISLVAAMIIFLMVGFDTSNGHFFKFVLNLFLTLLAAESQILVISYIFNHMLIAIKVTSFIMGSYMIMNGFFIKVSDIPNGWIWLHYLAFNSYSFKNFVYDAFKNLTIRKDLSTNPPAVNDFSGNAVLIEYSVEDVNPIENYFIIIGFILALRLLAITYSHFKHTGKR